MNKALRHFTATIFMIAGFTLFAGNARAQNDSSAPAPSSIQSASSVPATQSTDKKVWTNDDFKSVQPRDDASPSSNANTKPAGGVRKPKPNRGKNADWYRGQISRLQGQIPPLDEKIAQLQAALNGQLVNAPRPYGWSKPDDWRTQLAKFQKQRDDIELKISALEDEARHNGVSENELP
jgi:hypothetical protein